MGENLRHALAEVLARGDLHDPALRDVSITVTEVRVSPDLRNATVFVMPLGGTQLDDVMAGLQRARGYFRSQMARMVEARVVPDLSFKADESFDSAQRIDTLLRQSGTRMEDEGDGEP